MSGAMDTLSWREAFVRNGVRNVFLFVVVLDSLSISFHIALYAAAPCEVACMRACSCEYVEGAAPPREAAQVEGVAVVLLDLDVSDTSDVTSPTHSPFFLSLSLPPFVCGE